MICNMCCKHPSVAGKTDFLKGCTSFKKDTIIKHATGNCHIRAREKSFAEQKTVEESQIFQTFSKINKQIQAQDWKEMEIKLNTAYFLAKEELPFSEYENEKFIFIDGAGTCLVFPAMITSTLCTSV